MNHQERNQLIIQEILKWKENRLLPKEQCDFLLALYTKGGEVEITVREDNEKKNILLSLWKKLHFILILFILVSVIVLDYYDYLPLYIIVGILSVVAILNYFLYAKMSRNNRSRRYRYLFIFVQFLYVLQLSVQILQIIRLESLTNELIILNGIGWIVFGYVKKMPVFYYIGAVLVIGVLTYVVFLKYPG